MDTALHKVFNFVGEGPFWDTRTQELSLVDLCPISGVSKAFRWNPVTKSIKLFSFDQSTTFNIPTSDPGYSIISNKRDVLQLDWNEKAEQNTKIMVQVDSDKETNRFNDAKCDRRGVLIGGTMSEEKSPAVLINEFAGSLYRYGKGDQEPRVLDTGFQLSNGIDWTHDDKTMVFVDSIARLVYAFDYDIEHGSIVNKRVLIDFSKYETLSNGLPDGLTFDINNHLWIACFGIGKVVQFDITTGLILKEINFPTPCITSCCFGGPNLTDMYVTSSVCGAKSGLEDAGSLFRVSGSIHGTYGLPMNFFDI